MDQLLRDYQNYQQLLQSETDLLLQQSISQKINHLENEIIKVMRQIQALLESNKENQPTKLKLMRF